MHPMRYIPLLLTLLVVLPACRPDGAREQVVGAWRTVDGEARVFNFERDGSLRIGRPPGLGASVTLAFRYRFEDDSTMAVHPANSTETEWLVVRVVGDTLRLRLPETGEETRLVRIP
jgi:hypothetical protein